MRVSPLPRRAASENSGSSSEEEDEEAEDEEKKKKEDEEEDDDDDEPAAPTSSQTPAGADFYETHTIAGKKVSIRKVSAKLAKKSKNFTDLVWSHGPRLGRGPRAGGLGLPLSR